MRAKIPTLVRTFACKILSKVRAKVGTRIGTFAYNITGRDKKRREKNRREQDLCAAVAALSARLRENLAPSPAEAAPRNARPRPTAPAASAGDPASGSGGRAKAPANRPAPASGENVPSRRWIAFAVLACGAVLAAVLVLRRK